MESTFYQPSKGFFVYLLYLLGKSTLFALYYCLLTLKLTLFDVPLSQKSPITGELVTLGVEPIKPFAVVGIISGKLLCFVKRKKVEQKIVF